MPLRNKLRGKLVRAVRDAVAPDLEETRRVVLEEIRRSAMRDRRDILAAARREAAITSARYVVEHMPTVQAFNHKDGTLRHGLRLASDDGLALEFGVYSGATLRIIADQRGGNRVFGFDSFEGLPEDWRSGFPAGRFSMSSAGGPPEVRGAQLVVGWFEDSLPGFMADHHEAVAFLHVDCDLYSSTVTVLNHVGPRLVPGSIVVFDEYFNYPGWQSGEYLAWQEYCHEHGVKYSYEGYTRSNQQVVVRIL